MFIEEQEALAVSEQVKILVADDSGSMLKLLIETLQPLNEQVDAVSSGADALKHCLDSEYAVILMDVSMPVMSGFETATLIRKSKKSAKTPIIFITGVAENQDEILKGYAKGAVDYIIKPFNADILRSKVGVFVELYRMRQELAESRRLAKKQQLELEEFVKKLRSGEIDTLIGEGQSRKVFRLLDQKVLDENQRLVSELKQANSELQQMNQELNDFSHVAV